MNTSKALIQQLANSELFRNYEQAYATATGIPLALRPVETFDLPFHKRTKENAFCALMAKENRACASCLVTQEKLRQQAVEKTATTTCAHGLSEAAVPIRLGNKLIGFLQTGQIFTQRPSSTKVERVLARVSKLGVEEDLAAVRDAYLRTPVLARDKFRSLLKLLATFGELLSIKSNQIVVAENNAEHPIVTKAKKIIEEGCAEEISLGQVARQVHVSSFHLCKLFRRSAGMTFTEFVSRTRTEKAKNLLLNPQLRVSEIAYDVGFQSLTHFNRIFRKLTGESPTRFREKAGKGITARPVVGNCLPAQASGRLAPRLA
jgi:AraC-like DNA-binding protein